MSTRFLQPLSLAVLCGICCSAGWPTPRIYAAEWSAGGVIRLDPRTKGEHPPVVTAMAIHPGGQFVALGGDDHLVRIWDVHASRQTMTLRAHTDWVRTVSYSRQGDMLVTSGNDHRVVVWNTATGEILREYAQLSHVVTKVVFSHDSQLVAAVGFGDKLRIIDGTTGDRLRELDCPCVDMRTVAFSPDDRILVGGGRNGRIRLWDSGTGAALREFTAHSQRVRDLAFSDEGALLATCGEDRKVVISRSNGEHAFELPRQGAKVMTLVFCGQNQLATGGSDNVVRIWDLNRRTESAALSGHTGTVAVLAYHQGLLLSTGFDTTVRIWTRAQQSTGSSEGTLRSGGLSPLDSESK
jgi:WD40 repeat protein